MIIEPGSDGQFIVIGKVSETVTTGVKRDRSDDKEEAKRVRLQDGTSSTAEPEQKPPREKSEEPPSKADTTDRKGLGDVFLAHGIRDRLAKELDVGHNVHACCSLQALTITSLPFPVVDDEIYEPPADEDRLETLDEVTERVVGTLPRVQAIEALHGFQNMK